MEKYQKYIIWFLVVFIIWFALFIFISKKYYVESYWARNSVQEESKNWIIPSKIKNPENNKNWSWKWRM